jgi:hypothetical protein
MVTSRALVHLGFDDHKDFSLSNEGSGVFISEWNSDKKQPTEKEIETAEAECEKDFSSKKYQRDRQYPELGEQLDMLFRDMTAGKGDKTGEWYKVITKVKSDNPKPE